MKGNQYETANDDDSSPLKNTKRNLNSLKLKKTRSTELTKIGNSYRSKRLNRENPYKMSFNK